MKDNNQKNRVSLKVNRVLINGVEPTNTKVTQFTFNFNLVECLCGCSVRSPYKYHLIGQHWIEVEEHFEGCPNADPERFVAYVQ